MNWWNSIVEFITGAYQRAQGIFNYTQTTFNYAMTNIPGVREVVNHYTEIGTTGATPVPNLSAAIAAVGSSATPADVTTASGLAAAAYLPQTQARQHATVRALEESGATVTFISDPTRSDPECVRVVIAEKPGEDGKPGETIIAIRGTQVPGNGIGIDNAFNASCMPVEFPGMPGATVHAGFMNCYRLLSPAIQNKIQQAVERGDRITLTGHSQGAAVAEIIAADLGRTAGANLRLITFGKPYTCNHQLAMHIQQHCPENLRFADVHDPIRELAPPGCGFEHAARPIFIRGNQFSIGTMNENGTFLPTVASTAVSLISPEYFNAAHSQLNYDRAVNGLPVAAPPPVTTAPANIVKENVQQTAAGAITSPVSHGLPFGLFGNAVSVPALQATH